MKQEISKQYISDIVASVMASLSGENAGYQCARGCFLFDSMDDCITAAQNAAAQNAQMSLAQRRDIVEAMRVAARSNAELLAKAAYDETGYGSVAHKVLKCRLAADKTPGVEDLMVKTDAGDDGLTLTMQVPFGVVGAITPSTNPVATVINNAIGMVAAGNAVVFAPHPAAKACTKLAISILNGAVVEAGAPTPLLYCVKEPDIRSSQRLMEHPAVRLLAVTGGEAIVNIAMRTGKKVIAAGPGNPPVIVDETADIQRSAKDIVDGASFENNILCIAEKEVFVVESVGNALVKGMTESGAQLITPEQAESLIKTVLVHSGGKYTINRKFVGKDAAALLRAAGIPLVGQPRLITAIVCKDHPFVTTEMLMPILPVVYVRNVDEAIRLAVEAEGGCHHSAHMHSTNVDHLARAARALDTTIFVKNAPSYAGVGFGGEGHCTFTIATPTGEGLTSAKCFTRSRRCVLGGAFQIL